MWNRDGAHLFKFLLCCTPVLGGSAVRVGFKCRFLVCVSDWKQGFEEGEQEQKRNDILSSGVASFSMPRIW
jgi:hypothetical protein